MEVSWNRSHQLIHLWCHSTSSVERLEEEQQAALSVHDAAVESECATMSVFQQECMIENRNRAHVFFNTDQVKFSRDVAWLSRTRATFVQMNAALASVKSETNFSLARMDSCAAAGYFEGQKAEVIQRG